MIDAKVALRQVTRLAQMWRYPKGEPAAMNELVMAVSAANSEAIAATVIQGYLDTAKSDTLCPMPAEIRGAIYDANEKANPEAPERTHYHCQRCQDFGFYGGHIGGPYAGPWKVCSCAAGRGKDQIVDDANTVRTKLTAPRLPHPGGLAPVADVWPEGRE